MNGSNGISFTLNGKSCTFSGDPQRSLLKFLREEAGLISMKDGCAPEGSCGCCKVLINGKALVSCRTPMKKIAGASIVTNEGMEKKFQEAFMDAFVEKGGIQCGFCIPGMVAQGKELLDKTLNPTREEVRAAISKNLCRCTGYKKIEDSILYAAKIVREGSSFRPVQHDGRVGTRYPKYDSREAVLGLRPYVCDMQEPNMVFGALKFSDHPRAKVLKIDVSEANKCAGVLRIFTAKDFPGDRVIGLIVQDWPAMVGEGEETRYVGDVLAGVVAKTEDQARAAVEKIKIEYEVLAPVTDMFESLKPDAFQIHAKGNVLGKSKVKRGDADGALKNSAHVVHGIYETQRIEHAYMEPESALAKPWSYQGRSGIFVFSQGQGSYEDRIQIAKLLNLPLEQVNVLQVQNGGGFGGKEDLATQGHAALFAFLLNLPVKVTLNRKESLLMHPKRHPLHMDYTLGCDKNGKLTALKAVITGDTGAYASVGMKVLERAVGHCTGAYNVPNVEVTGTAVYTNNIPAGAMRGFGANQATFAMESCVDELCEKGGFDRFKFRYDNALTEGDVTATGQVIKSGAGVRATLDAVKDDYYQAKYAGLACGIKNTGIGNGMPDIGVCKIVIEAADRVVVHHGWTEMGQGVHTMALQTLCEETGIDPKFVAVHNETKEATVCGMTTASRGTSLVGNSVIVAAKSLREDLKTKTLKDLVGKEYRGEWKCDWTTKPGYEKPGQEIVTHYSYSYATQLVILNEQGKIEKVIAAHDAGKIMNPTLFEGQIEGSVHMGLGYAISEDFEMEGGVPKDLRLSACGVLRARETPEIEVRGVEVKDAHGPYGVKGVGEIGLVPTAPAVTNALYQYDKKRRYKLPIHEKQILGKAAT